MRRRTLIAMAVALTIGACSRGASVGATQGSADSSDTGSVAASPQPALGMPNVPVDTSLAAVSLSNPPVGAKEALSMCVRSEDLSKVAGMAQLPANQVHRFTLTNGNEPELQTDKLVWAIQMKGSFASRTGVGIIDPLCVVIDGISHRYVPYGGVDGKFVPPADFVAATAALPSLAP